MSLKLFEKLPVGSQERLDRACARFEKAWGGPTPPDPEDFLADAPPAERAAWLTELLHIDVEYRRRAGRTVSAETYRASFPRDRAVVDEVLATTAGVPGVGSVVGKYQLTRVLGRGGMGVVYEAEDPVIRRRVAVKLLDPDHADTARLIEEARHAARLQHPNIVTVYEAGQADGVWYMAMELLAATAGERLRTGGAYLPEVATRIAADVCQGLTAAHAAGLVHRDIKPANVLLTAATGSEPSPDTSAGQPLAKLSDFGLAHQDGAAGPLAAAGTPVYMAPEQFAGAPAGPAADLYSLGATYFALLTGRPPYAVGTAADAMAAHSQGAIPDPRAVDEDLPPVCTRVVARAMAKDPADRYPSADAMLADLQAALTACAPGRRRWRRRVVRVSAAALVAGVVVCAAVLGLRSGPPGVAEPETGWVSLFDGRGLTGWEVFVEGGRPGEDPDRQFTVVRKDGEPAIRVRGTRRATLTSDRDMSDYHLRLEYRWEKVDSKQNSGIMYHASGAPGEGFPGAMPAHELELAPRNIGGYFRSGNHRTADAASIQDGVVYPVKHATPTIRAAQDREFKTGRWNVVELVCWQDTALHVVNGYVVFVLTNSRLSTPAGQVPLTGGRVQIQSNQGEVYFRRIEVRPISSIPSRFLFMPYPMPRGAAPKAPPPPQG